MISSQTKLYGVIGDPIGHSLSPILQNWLLDRYGIDGRYVAFQVTPDNLANAIHGMQALGIHGLNVTIPHKEKVLAYLTTLSPDAQLLGSANTILNKNGILHGFNTDVPGFINSVENLHQKFFQSRVIVLGAGGAARAVVYALKKLEISELVLCDLSLTETKPLEDKCRAEFGLTNVNSWAIDDPRLIDIVNSCSVLINATPVGMLPNTDRSPLPDNIPLHKEMLAYDLIYNPAQTKLLADAQKSGAIIKNGLDMLIFQGAASMSIWTDKQIDLEQSALNEIRYILNKAMIVHE
jgi:shikimate dehydrogenase